MKATVFLRKDHERIAELFSKYRKAKHPVQNGSRTLIEQIRREIYLHSAVEAEIFYPALQTTTSAQAEELVESAGHDHEHIDSLLELAASNHNGKAAEAMQRLMDAVEAHIEREEQDLFAEARLNLSEQRLEELGLEMEDRRRLMTQLAA
jgi:hemerythrin superfamily protein